MEWKASVYTFVGNWCACILWQYVSFWEKCLVLVYVLVCWPVLFFVSSVCCVVWVSVCVGVRAFLWWLCGGCVVALSFVSVGSLVQCAMPVKAIPIIMNTPERKCCKLCDKTWNTGGVHVKTGRYGLCISVVGVGTHILKAEAFVHPTIYFPGTRWI